MIYSIPLSELHNHKYGFQYNKIKISEIRQLLEKYLLYLTIFQPAPKKDELFNSLLLCFDYDDSNLFQKMRKLSIDEIRDTFKGHSIYKYWTKVPLVIKIICTDVISINKQTLRDIGLPSWKIQLFFELKKKILEDRKI